MSRLKYKSNVFGTLALAAALALTSPAQAKTPSEPSSKSPSVSCTLNIDGQENILYDCTSQETKQDFVNKVIQENDAYFEENQTSPFKEDWKIYKYLLNNSAEYGLDVLVEVTTEGVSVGLDGVTQQLNPLLVQRPNKKLDYQELISNYSEHSFTFDFAKLITEQNSPASEGYFSFGLGFAFLHGAEDDVNGFSGNSFGFDLTTAYHPAGEDYFLGTENFVLLGDGSRDYTITPQSVSGPLQDLEMRGKNHQEISQTVLGTGVLAGYENLLPEDANFELGLEGHLGITSTWTTATSAEQSAYFMENQLIQGTDLHDQNETNDFELNLYFGTGLPFGIPLLSEGSTPDSTDITITPEFILTTNGSVGASLNIGYRGL